VRSLRERVFSRLIVDPSGCLLWTGAITSRGYGQVSSGNRNVPVHRLTYEWFVGPIPDGMEIDHLCRVKHCAAPAHLEAVTHRENVLRGRSPSALQARQTHCIHGHELTADNTYTPPGKYGRLCRICKRESQRNG